MTAGGSVRWFWKARLAVVVECGKEILVRLAERLYSLPAGSPQRHRGKAGGHREGERRGLGTFCLCELRLFLCASVEAIARSGLDALNKSGGE
jgi:hypothetical protein